jgi:hypothetical protein
MRNYCSKNAAKVLLGNVLIFVLLILAGEVLFGLLYHFPRGNLLIRTAREYYLYCDRITVTYEDGQGRYDPLVSYTFEPGTFKFANREYDTTYYINSAGLRDDEASLDSPEIVILGDSHSAGWGVEQNETYAQRIEEWTGYRVLNSSIPSFATPREVLLLSRLNIDSLKAILIQYSDNDWAENVAFRDHGYLAHIQSQGHYEEVRKVYSRMTRHYKPGRYLRIYFPMLVRQALQGPSGTPIPLNLLAPRDPSQEAADFLNVLLSTCDMPANVPIIVFEIVSYNWNSDGFVDALDSLLATPEIGGNDLPDISTVRLSQALTSDHYFVYDDHPNAMGHAAIAEILTRHLQTVLQRITTGS